VKGETSQQARLYFTQQPAPGDSNGGIITEEMLTDLAVIMCVAALTTLIFRRIRQPVVLGYLVAGLIIGPHVPMRLLTDKDLAHQMAEIGVVLLMFSLGLQFSLRRLIRVGLAAALVAIIECSFMIWLGYGTGRLFGWTRLESIFSGAIIAISSTTIVVKAFAGQRVKGKFSDVVFGILIVEDLIAIVLLALLTPLGSGAGLSLAKVGLAVGKLAAFLTATLALGLLVVPRLVRTILRAKQAETTVVACVGISFAMALLARYFGYSVALGAFLAGALVAESGAGEAIERTIEPVRDMFAAVFFVSVGMLIDPGLIAQHWLPVLAFTVVVVLGKVVGVTLGAFLTGHSVRTSFQAGMSLAQIGEFSFIIAGLGLSLGAVGRFLYPVAVAVSALTTLITPFLMRASGPVASFVDRRLPHPLQTFVSLYGSWLAALRAGPKTRTTGARVRRLVLLLALDTVLVAAITIAASLNVDRLANFAATKAGVGPGLVRAAIAGLSILLASPFVLGAVRVARALGTLLAAQALPTQQSTLDLAEAPRRALLVTMQLSALLAAGIPLVAITQPFLPSVPGAALLLIAVGLSIIPFWRSATELHGHVQAGAQVLLEALASQGSAKDEPLSDTAEARRLVPGLGEAATLRLAPGDSAVARTLGQLNLRGLTGATVIAVERSGQGVVYPGAHEPLLAGDVLVFTGTDAAVAAARQILLGQVTPQPVIVSP
jgi:monovalent cation:H+ antiporter-2, CPA2 family